jgi:FeS assembly protein SufD
MSKITPVIERYCADFERINPSLAGSGLPWLRRLREEALSRFADLGFPTERDEEWKYTRVAPIEKRRFVLAQPVFNGVSVREIEPFIFAEMACHRLVFMNGHFHCDLSRLRALPQGVFLGSLAHALEQEPEALQNTLAHYVDGGIQGFVALNTAFMQDGLYLRLPKDTVIAEPIHLLYLSTSPAQPVVAHPHNLIVADEGSQVTLIEHYVGLTDSEYFNNVVTEIAAGNNSSIEHYKLQQEHPNGFHIATIKIHQGTNSRFMSHNLSLGGALTRNDLRVALDAEGAECTLNGLYMVGGRQHVDNHTRVDHTKPRGSSREWYRGVLDGRSRAVFNGKVIVHQDAQKTDAHQTNKNLLLSREAEVNTKPELMIYADDVKCTHGATVGQLDPDIMFYLRTRGISEQAARALLTHAFATDILNRLSLAPIRNHIGEICLSRLPESQLIKGLL